MIFSSCTTTSLLSQQFLAYALSGLVCGCIVRGGTQAIFQASMISPDVSGDSKGQQNEMEFVQVRGASHPGWS